MNVNIVCSLENTCHYNMDYDFIGVDRGAYYLSLANIKMILAIGDFDSVNEKEFNTIKDCPIVKLDSIKNMSDLEYAIIEANKNNYDHMYIYGALGQRLDHTLVNINLLEKYPNLTFIDEYNEVTLLKKGSHQLKADSNYKYYSFFSLSNDTFISLENFKYNIDNYQLLLNDTRCFSNEIEDISTITTNKDIILIKSI